MAFDFTTAKTMTKALSVLLAGSTDQELQDALAEHAVPRVKMYLLASTDSSGKTIFYSVLGDMADATKAATAENLVDALMDEAIVRDALRRCAAAFAASWLIVSKFGILEVQGKVADMLEKQAMADLERLCKSQIMSTAVATVAKEANISPDLSVGAALFIATDVDPASLDITNKTARPYTGAQLPWTGASEAGKITAIINGSAIEAIVQAGDSPADIINKLVLAFNAIPVDQRPNVNLAPGEVVYTNDSRQIEYTDPLSGQPVLASFRYPRKMARLAIVPKNYDNQVDVAVVTTFLTHRNQTTPSQFDPGITGLVFGTENTSALLTPYGPHTIAVELKTGKTTSTSTPTSSGTTTPISDSLFFVDNGSPTAYDSVITYRVNDNAVQTVPVPTGSDAQKVAELLAKDMADKASSQRILGAVRPSSKITVNGSALTAPGLELVAFGLENTLSHVIFTVLSVPGGIDFGVVPYTLVTQSVFDDRAKSVVVTTTIAPRDSSSTAVVTNPTSPNSEVFQATHIPTAGLKNILDQFKKFR